MDSKRTIQFPADRQPERVDRFLAGTLPELSRSAIKQLIIDSSVLCNGKAVKPSYKAVPGDRFEITIPEPKSMEVAPENIPLDFLFQDGDIAIINKPAGMMVHPAGAVATGTLVNALLYHLQDLSGINGILRPGIVHRLDKDTTGVMIVAKNDRSHRYIAEQFESHRVSKTYLALVWGVFDPAQRNGAIHRSISRSMSNRKKMVSGNRGRKSTTLYRVRQEYEFLSFIEAFPKTGRTHQIRSHFASIGHPVFGDSLYRGRNRRLTHLSVQEYALAARMLKHFPRQALHAAEISFEHPSTHDQVTFSAPLPADFMNILSMLEQSAEISP
ncbi:RluA family pseudouridine synthase [candidate division KSB1 bacterium]